MKKLEILSDDAVLIDDVLFKRVPTYEMGDHDRCPKCGDQIYWSEQTGFVPRPGCRSCNIWLAPAVLQYR